MAADANTVSEVAVQTIGWLNETTLYYAYSTIAQTLAGAFGILGAFVLYHLATTNRMLEEYGGKLYDICHHGIHNVDRDNTETINEWFHRNQWDSIVEYFDKDREGASGYLKEPGVVSSHERLRYYFGGKQRMLRNLRITLYFTAITIALSLILIPFTPMLAQHVYLSIGCLIVVIGVSILCIHRYVQLISEALK